MKIKREADLVEATGEPLTNKKMIRFAYDAVLKTGMFSDNLRFWRNKAENIKKWLKFQIFMAKQYNDYFEDQDAETSNPFSGHSLQEDTF